MENKLSKKLDLIKYLQKPEANRIINPYYKGFLLDEGELDTKALIEFEDQFSIEKHSNINCKYLYQILCLISVLNADGGLNCYLMNDLTIFKRLKIVSQYYNLREERMLSFSPTLSYNNMVSWCYQNFLISELEAMRLINNNDFDIYQIIDISDFNKKILEKGLDGYAKDYI